jgi:hypothetical protein
MLQHLNSLHWALLQNQKCSIKQLIILGHVENVTPKRDPRLRKLPLRVKFKLELKNQQVNLLIRPYGHPTSRHEDVQNTSSCTNECNQGKQTERQVVDKENFGERNGIAVDHYALQNNLAWFLIRYDSKTNWSTEEVDGSTHNRAPNAGQRECIPI